MPRKKKLPDARKVLEHERTTVPKIGDGAVYSLLIALIVVLISGAYYRTSECAGNCQGENIANGYPYPWFSYNIYEGWQAGSVNWLGGVLDVVFWMAIAYVIMLVLYAAIKEV